MCIDRLADSFDEAIYNHNRNLWLSNLKKFDDLYYSLKVLDSLPGFINLDLSEVQTYSHILDLY